MKILMTIMMSWVVFRGEHLLKVSATIGNKQIDYYDFRLAGLGIESHDYKVFPHNPSSNWVYNSIVGIRLYGLSGSIEDILRIPIILDLEGRFTFGMGFWKINSIIHAGTGAIGTWYFVKNNVGAVSRSFRISWIYTVGYTYLIPKKQEVVGILNLEFFQNIGTVMLHPRDIVHQGSFGHYSGFRGNIEFNVSKMVRVGLFGRYCNDKLFEISFRDPWYNIVWVGTGTEKGIEGGIYIVFPIIANKLIHIE